MTLGGPGERPDRKPGGPSSPAPPAEEPERLEALHRYRVLDTAPEPALDRIAALAARLFGAPIALVSLVDRDRQWFKSTVGLAARETERAVSFCGHAILGDGVMVVGQMEKAVSEGRLQRLPDDLRRVRDAAERMHRLLDELLEISRIGRVVDAPQDTPFGDLVREALALVGGRVTARGVQVELLGNQSVAARGDRRRLVQVLQNLLDNAARFAGASGPPRVEAGVRESSGPPVFFVRDNGPGIEPRHHERIFRLFVKLDPASEGTGVGLAIVQRIVDLHGGRVWVESEGRGSGATFCFTLAGARPPVTPPPSSPR